LLEHHAGREGGERHAVASVAERKEVARVAAMATDVGQAVFGEREESFPSVLELDVGKRGKQSIEMLA
jgi:hypothetical protein